MSNLIKITLFFLTYCYCEAYENNVANNYSFEDDTDGNSIADHVQFRSQAPPNLLLDSTQNAHARTGSRCVEFTPQSNNQDSYITSNFNVASSSRESFPCAERDLIGSSIYVKASENASGSNVKLDVLFFNASTGAAIADGNTPYQTSVTNLSTGWQRISVVEVAPPTANFAALRLTVGGLSDGTVYADDWEIYLMPDEEFPETGNLVANNSDLSLMGTGGNNVFDYFQNNSATGHEITLENDRAKFKHGSTTETELYLNSNREENGQKSENAFAECKPGEIYEASATIEIQDGSYEGAGVKMMLYFYRKNSSGSLVYDSSIESDRVTTTGNSKIKVYVRGETPVSAEYVSASVKSKAKQKKTV